MHCSSSLLFSSSMTLYNSDAAALEAAGKKEVLKVKTTRSPSTRKSRLIHSFSRENGTFGPCWGCQRALFAPGKQRVPCLPVLSSTEVLLRWFMVSSSRCWGLSASLAHWRRWLPCKSSSQKIMTVHSLTGFLVHPLQEHNITGVLNILP